MARTLDEVLASIPNSTMVQLHNGTVKEHHLSESDRISAAREEMAREDDAQRKVGRRRINHEQMPARFPLGTLSSIDVLLEDKESRSDFIRDAVQREIERRWLATSEEERKAVRERVMGKHADLIKSLRG